MNTKVNTLLNERLKKTEGPSKMDAMAKQSANGHLTSFAGIFSMTEINERDKESIASILKTYALDPSTIQGDLSALVSLTSEVKSINNQAALLHGERIKKAHHILINYREGAFTAWLIAAYGNRQTPYNLMQYYEFCEMMPKSLRLQIEAMPRQAIYTLASRDGAVEKKRSIVENYNGETKAQLLEVIREKFPLDTKDGRKQDVADSCIQTLKKLQTELEKRKCKFSSSQRKSFLHILEEIHRTVCQDPGK